MTIAFVLVTTEAKKESTVYGELVDRFGDDSVYGLFGEYDILVKFCGDDPERMGRRIVDDIRGVDGVLDTKTLMGIRI